MVDSGSAVILDPAAADPVRVARDSMLAQVAPLAGGEVVPLHAARGRVLARSLEAKVSSPPADNSAMDGYALRVTDLEAADGTLPVGQRIPAGTAPAPLATGTAARIFTGGVIPRGADAVVIQERCHEERGTVTVAGRVTPGDNIRPAGEDVCAGSTVLQAGLCLRPQEIGLAATAGHGHVPVHRRVRACVAVTGDELVTAGQPLAPGCIYNSNGPMLAALLEEVGCEVVGVYRIADTRVATRDALARAAAEADIVITSGGVSVGEEDHVRAAVGELGSISVHQVPLKPGKPVAFGEVAGTAFIGLPGNPVSLFVTFALFGGPVLRRMQGRTTTLAEPLRLPAGFSREAGKRDEFLRVRVEDGRLREFAHQGSGVLSSAQWASGLARIRAGATVFAGGELDYYPMSDLLA